MHWNCNDIFTPIHQPELITNGKCLRVLWEPKIALYQRLYRFVAVPSSFNNELYTTKNGLDTVIFQMKLCEKVPGQFHHLPIQIISANGTRRNGVQFAEEGKISVGAEEMKPGSWKVTYDISDRTFDFVSRTTVTAGLESFLNYKIEVDIPASLNETQKDLNPWLWVLTYYL